MAVRVAPRCRPLVSRWRDGPRALRATRHRHRHRHPPPPRPGGRSCSTGDGRRLPAARSGRPDRRRLPPTPVGGAVRWVERVRRAGPGPAGPELGVVGDPGVDEGRAGVGLGAHPGQGSRVGFGARAPPSGAGRFGGVGHRLVGAPSDPPGSTAALLVRHGVTRSLDGADAGHEVAVAVQQTVQVAQALGPVATQDGEAHRAQLVVAELPAGEPAAGTGRRGKAGRLGRTVGHGGAPRLA